MTAPPAPPPAVEATAEHDGAGQPVRRPRRRRWFVVLSVFALLLVAARLAMPSMLRWYVNRVLDRGELYTGRIGDVDVHLWRGAYSIEDVAILKRIGDVPVPLFAAERVDLAIDWRALFAGEVVGRIAMEAPELNFVDGGDRESTQTGAGAPWLQMLDQLFPFEINSAVVHRGRMHFRAFRKQPQVDVYLSEVEGALEDLTNVHDQVTPLFAKVRLEGLAMDQAKVELEMELDPTSYRPSFQLALRLLGLDVTKTRDLTRAYGAFDFESGWFDLVVELDAKEGQLEGYAKPLFRDVRVIDLSRDLAEDNVLQVFWEALVGLVGTVLENPPRDQIGTRIPIRGSLTDPRTDVLATIGNLLRNAFVRAYLPRLEGTATDLDGVTFGPAVDLGPAVVK